MSERLRWASTFVVPALFGLATIVLQGANGTTLYDDELGYLGEAVYLSARSGEAVLNGIPFYPAGYPALLAVPLSLFPFDPWVVAVAVNLVLLASMGPVLFWIVRTAFDVSDRLAAAAAIAGAVVPSVVFQVPRAWSEVAVAFGFTVWAALLLRWSRIGPGPGAVPLALVTGALLSLHRRTLVVVLVTVAAIVVWSLWQGVRPPAAAVRGGRPHLDDRLRAVPWLPMLAALGACAAAVAGALALDGVVADNLYQGVTSGNRFDKAENLRSTIWIPALLGHVWSVLATTFGVAGVGLLTLCWWIFRSRDAVWATVLGLAVGGVVMTSVTFLASGIRADQLVYERYVAPVTPVLVAVGVAGLALRLESVRWTVLATGVVLAGAGGILSISLEASRLTGNIHKFTVPALTTLNMAPVGWGDIYIPQFHVVPITAVSVAGLAAVVVVTRWADRGVLAVVALWAGVVAVGSAGNLRPFVEVWQPTGREAAGFLDERDVQVLGYAPHTRHESRNVLQYRLGYPEAVLVDPESCPPEPWFVGPPRLEESHDVVPVVEIVNFPGIVYERRC